MRDLLARGQERASGIRDHWRDLIASLPGRAAAVAVALAFASVWILGVAAQETAALELVWKVALGAAPGALSLLIGSRLLAVWTSDGAAGWTLPVGIALIVCGLGAGAVVINRIENLDSYLAPGGLVVAMVGILLVNLRSATHARSKPVLWLVGGALVMVVAVGGMTGGSAARSVIAAFLWVLGLTAIKLGLSPLLRAVPASATGALWTAQVARRGTIAAVIAGLVAAGGALWLGIADLATSGAWVIVTAVTLVFVGLSSLPIAALHVVPDSRWEGSEATRSPAVVWLPVGAAGAALALVGTVLTIDFLPDWRAFGLFVSGLLAVVAAFFVFRGEGIVFLVIFGFVLSWVLTERSAEPQRVTEADHSGVLVAFGDSFMSGQGAVSYLPGTNTRGTEGNNCRRSPNAYAYLVGYELDRTVKSYACSGAETRHITDTGQKPDTDASSPVPGRLPQLNSVRHPVYGVDVTDVDLALVAIGGNDAFFATVVAACVLPSDCSERESEWRARLLPLEAELEATYKAIVDGLPEAELVVIPYPAYLGLEACDRSLTQAEHDFVARFLNDLNARIESAAARAGPRVHLFPHIDRAYLRHTLCDPAPGANFIHLFPSEGPLLQRLSPTAWHEGTAHPRELGHRCTAAVLTRWIVEESGIDLDLPAARPEREPAPGCAEPTDDDLADYAELLEPVLAASSGDRVEPFDPEPWVTGSGASICVRDPQRDVSCFVGEDWVAETLKESLGTVFPAFLMVFAGALLAALALARIGLPFAAFLVPEPPSYPGPPVEPPEV